MRNVVVFWGDCTRQVHDVHGVVSGMMESIEVVRMSHKMMIIEVSVGSDG